MGKQRFITEVWDYRLSTAAPLIYWGMPESEDAEGVERDPDDGLDVNWVACVYDKSKDRDQPLECFNTGIKFTNVNDNKNQQAGYDACYKFYRSVRDKYSLENIEELKPLVAEIRRVDKIRQKATDAYNAVMQENK